MHETIWESWGRVVMIAALEPVDLGSIPSSKSEGLTRRSYTWGMNRAAGEGYEISAHGRCRFWNLKWKFIPQQEKYYEEGR